MVEIVVLDGDIPGLVSVYGNVGKGQEVFNAMVQLFLWFV